MVATEKLGEFVKLLDTYLGLTEKTFQGVPKAVRNFERAELVQKIGRQIYPFGLGDFFGVVGYTITRAAQAIFTVKGWGCLRGALESPPKLAEVAAQIDEVYRKLSETLPKDARILADSAVRKLPLVVKKFEEELMDWCKKNLNNPVARSVAYAFLRNGGYKTPAGGILDTVFGEVRKTERLYT